MNFLRKIFLICAILLAAPLTNVLAVPSFSSAQLTTPGTTRTLVLPPIADNAPVISLGTAVDFQTGQLVEGFAIIHHKEKAVRPAAVRAVKNQCYGFLAPGAKWKNTEDYLVDAFNNQGLDAAFVSSTISSDLALWEDAADGNVDGSVINNIFGNEVLGIVDGADTVAPDGKNEVMFGEISSSGTIAVTIVWGIFSGPPPQRMLVEWDQIYNQKDFAWSANGEAGKMDFDNIAMHELGHSAGLADVYNSGCSEVTMFGYGDLGEIKKQTLESADIVGISTLY